MMVPDYSTTTIFNRELTRLVNGAVYSRSDYLTACLFPEIHTRKHARRIISRYKNLYLTGNVSSKVSLNVPVYTGNNEYVRNMMKQLSVVEADIVGAYVHGSLGNYDEIQYSDFDALVILKDDVLASEDRLVRCVRRLSKLRNIMVNFDPLQHHGWFVITESELLCYDESIFPLILFDNCKSLLTSNGRQLSVYPLSGSITLQQHLYALATNIIKRIDAGNFPTNLYQLKTLLSEFMLLPALYLQAINGTGIFKKDSFSAARKGFDADEWRIMDEISAIREQWVSQPNWLQHYCLTNFICLRRLLVNLSSPRIPAKLNAQLDNNFYTRMKHLAKRFLKQHADT